MAHAVLAAGICQRSCSVATLKPIISSVVRVVIQNAMVNVGTSKWVWRRRCVP